jgi:hypothetical protein
MMTGTESWAVKKQKEDFNTNVIGKALREAAPHGASYVNEVSSGLSERKRKLKLMIGAG